MFIDSKADIADEVNHINCTLGKIAEIDRRLRIDNRTYIGQIEELHKINKEAAEEALSATQRAKNSERLRFRDVGVAYSLFVVFALFVILVNLGSL